MYSPDFSIAVVMNKFVLAGHAEATLQVTRRKRLTNTPQRCSKHGMQIRQFKYSRRMKGTGTKMDLLKKVQHYQPVRVTKTTSCMDTCGALTLCNAMVDKDYGKTHKKSLGSTGVQGL